MVRSGIQYGRDTVEFRLCREHFSRKLFYEVYSIEFIMQKLSHLYIESVRQLVSKDEVERLSEVHNNKIDYIASILDPVRYAELKEQTKRKSKNTPENKVAYLEALGDSFSSIEDIFSKINALNQKIKHADT